MPHKILITTSSFQFDTNPAIDSLREAGFEIVLNPFGRRLSADEAAELFASHDPRGMIAGVEPLSGDVLKRARNLKVISRCGVGLDSVDLSAASAQEIDVTVTPGGPTAAVSELTLALMLDCCRRVSEADRNVRNGAWGAAMGRLLASQTVGLIGFGRIGRAVAERCLAFEATVIAHDMQIDEGAAYPVEMVGMDELLGRSDIVSLHVPKTPETENLLNSERIAAMKPDSILINAARGGLLDEEALCAALKSGALAAAGIDCFSDEPYSGPLIECETAVLTAHMGSYAREARSMMEREAADNLLNGLREKGIVS